MRVVRRVLPLVLILLVVAAIATILTSRPQLEDAESEVESRWETLAAALDARYDALRGVTDAVATDAGPAAELAAEVDAALDGWVQARGTADAAAGVRAANALEGLGRRLDRAVRASPRLAANADLVAALDAYAAMPAPEPLAAFTTAVRAYEEERTGPLRGVVADVLGYDPVPTLALGA